MDRDHPEIAPALRGLAAWSEGKDLKPDDAKQLLDRWRDVNQLSDQAYAATLGWCGWTRRSCAQCGELIMFVADGPDPGWWSHDLVPTQPHPAVPVVTR